MITSFSNEFSFLSNFFLCDVPINGWIFPSSEHAFMSHKNNSTEWKKECLYHTPGQIKRLARKVKLIDNWDIIKFSFMKQCVLSKFLFNKDLRQLLISTGDQELIEGNTWGDKIWGAVWTDDGWVGDNNLGKILMEVRDILNAM